MYIYPGMKYNIIVWTLVFLSFGTEVLAQKKVSKKASRVAQPAQLLDQARQLKDKSPNEAIKLLEQVIFQKSKSPDYQNQGAAYLLLGDIYQSIDQPDLALKRYLDAEKIYLRAKNQVVPAAVYQRQAQLFLSNQNTNKASDLFKICIEKSTDKQLTISCQEGLASVSLAEGENEESLEQLDYVQNNYDLDSTSVARVEALRSQNYSRQSKPAKAQESYYNSIKNLPEVKQESNTLSEVKKAKDELLDKNTPAKQLEIKETSAAISSLNRELSDLAISENLELSEAYLINNEIEKAADFIKKSKAVIGDQTAAGARAEVFKRSFEINRTRGAMEEALLDLDQYISARELDITELEKTLQEKIEIVKRQQNIDLALKDLDIEEKDDALLATQLQGQKMLSGFLGILLLGALVFFYFLNKNVKSKRRANQMLLLKSLRTQMNPHFIFNALNSVNNFIAKNDEKAANKFLSDFSKLMRKVLDYSQKDFIHLEEEVELNQLYLKLEHFRFRDKFDYTFENNLEEIDIEIPPMLIQPFIENAVWHGLRYKEGHGQLAVQLSNTKTHLHVTISDNGIGRKKSLALKTNNQKKYKSTGLANISRRVALINELYGKGYEINVFDPKPEAAETGTKVVIKIPL